MTVAQRRGIVAAWARCTEAASSTPFWPVTQLGDQLDAAGAITAPLVALPDIDAVAPSRARFDLYRAVLGTLGGLAQPALLVIDDVQWADPDSLRLLEHAAAELTSPPVLVVLNTRPLGDDAPRALVDCLGEIARMPASMHVRLGGLEPAAVAEWLSRRSDVDVPPAVAAVVHQRTGGNPLFVRELADLLAAEGRLGDPAAVQASRAIPPEVQFVVRRRVSRLAAPTQQLLTLAAVIGPSIDVGVLAAVAELDLDAALDALAPALDAGLLVDDGAGALRFSHALVADALADEVNAARRARAHAATARALAAVGGRWRPSRLPWEASQASTSLTGRANRSLTASLASTSLMRASRCRSAVSRSRVTKARIDSAASAGPLPR